MNILVNDMTFYHIIVNDENALGVSDLKVQKNHVFHFHDCICQLILNISN